MAREFAFRLSNTPPEAVGVRCKTDLWLGHILRAPPVLLESAPGPHGVVARMPASQKATAVHIGVAAGAWQTAAESKTRGGDVLQLKGSRIAFWPAEEKDGCVTIAVAHDLIDAQGEGPQVRVIAVDLDGLEHSGESCQRTGSEKLTQLMVTFSKLSLKDTKAFRLQTRPYQWTEFCNVSLQAGQ